MPFDATAFDVNTSDVSTAAIDPALAARPSADHPTAHRPIHPVADGSRSPAAEEDGSADVALHGGAPASSSAPAACSSAPAAGPLHASVPFYSTRYPRPVCAIAPRVARGVI